MELRGEHSGAGIGVVMPRQADDMLQYAVNCFMMVPTFLKCKFHDTNEIGCSARRVGRCGVQIQRTTGTSLYS